MVVELTHISFNAMWKTGNHLTFDNFVPTVLVNLSLRFLSFTVQYIFYNKDVSMSLPSLAIPSNMQKSYILALSV